MKANEYKIEFLPRDIPSWIRQKAEDPEDVSEVITVVRRHLAETQPVLLKHLAFGKEKGKIVIEIAASAPPGIHVGVEAALGLESLLSEFAYDSEMREIEVEMEEFEIEVSDDLPDNYMPEPLRSLVTYYPLPDCEWYEYTTGVLGADTNRVVFRSEYEVLSAQKGRGGAHYYDLSEIVSYGPDRWWRTPCLRIVTGAAGYRYAWTSGFDDISMEFDIEEWMRVLERLAPQAERVLSYG